MALKIKLKNGLINYWNEVLIILRNINAFLFAKLDLRSILEDHIYNRSVAIKQTKS